MGQKASRAVIYSKDNSCVISIKRTKKINNEIKVYYTFPGGHVEYGETFEEAVVREVLEELGICVKTEKLICKYFSVDLNKHENFYRCSYLSGEVGTGKGEEFTNVDEDKYGKYEIVHIPIKDIDKYNLLPTQVANMIK